MKLSMRSIFRCMMEEGFYPTYEKTHILFCIDDNLGVVEYEEGIVSIRLFFSIEEEFRELFMDASNITMEQSYAVKSVVLDDLKNIMFSCEFLCDTEKEFRKFLPRATGLISEALDIHKEEMKKLILAESVTTAAIPQMDEMTDFGSGPQRKILS